MILSEKSATFRDHAFAADYARECDLNGASPVQQSAARANRTLRLSGRWAESLDQPTCSRGAAERKAELGRQGENPDVTVLMARCCQPAGIKGRLLVATVPP